MLLALSSSKRPFVQVGRSVLLLCAVTLTLSVNSASAQPEGTESIPAQQRPEPAGPVQVAPDADDEDIERRLKRILEAAGWFEPADVRVEEGIVFLTGQTSDEHARTWASDVARRTEGVVAVVNRMEIVVSGTSRFSPAWQGLRDLWQTLLRDLPAYALATVLLALAYGVGRSTTKILRASFLRRQRTDIIRDITARAAGVVLFVLGLYVALRVAGLTRLAATVLGGTGVVGLILGIAFRDIAENVLASILLTRQQPFRRGDLVEIGGIEGYVQSLTLRATVLMNLEGNHVQIPNSTVYKSSIRNFSSNAARRVDFTVGIGYDDAIPHAQETALGVITEHPAVLKQPEPWVLAEGLGSAVVQLRIYAWLDGSKHSWLKVRSSLIRLVKRAFQERGISMPDEAREVVFPQGVPVRLVDANRGPAAPEELAPGRPNAVPENADFATGAEAGLGSEASSIARLAFESRTPEAGQDLLAKR